MMHHHAKFGYNRFSGSGDTVRTNSHWHFDLLLWPWPWTQQCSFLTRHSCLRISSSKDTIETVKGWLYKPSLWPWPWSKHYSIPAWHSISWWCTTTLSLLTKGSVISGSGDIVQTNIPWRFEHLLWPWPWPQLPNFLTRHSGLWWSTIKPSLVIKGSTV